MVDDVTFLITFVQVNRTFSDLVRTQQCMSLARGQLFFVLHGPITAAQLHGVKLSLTSEDLE